MGAEQQLASMSHNFTQLLKTTDNIAECENNMTGVNHHWSLFFSIILWLVCFQKGGGGAHRDCDQCDKPTTGFPPEFLLFMGCLFPAAPACSCWGHSVCSSGSSFKSARSIDLPSGQSANHLRLEGAQLQKDAHKDRFVPEWDWRSVCVDAWSPSCSWIIDC